MLHEHNGSLCMDPCVTTEQATAAQLLCLLGTDGAALPLPAAFYGVHHCCADSASR